MRQSIPACHFPTRIFLVDDHRDVLEKLQRGLDNSLVTYQISTKPLDVLESLNASYEPLNRWVSLEEEGRLVTNLDKLCQEIYNFYRFEAVSTVIVDYDMPEMTGLEFCQKIKSPYIQKILLTGAANEEVALKAFNYGIINHYIRKHDPDVFEQLEAYCAASQYRYFKALTQPLMDSLTFNVGATALNDPIFVEFFSDFIKKENITEYYLMETMGSFLCLNRERKVGALFIYTNQLLDYQDETIDEMREEDKDQQFLTPNLLRDLKQRRQAFSFNYFNNQSFPEKDQWHNYIHPLHLLEGGRQSYYWSYVPEYKPVHFKPVASYEKFRQ